MAVAAFLGVVRDDSGRDAVSGGSSPQQKGDVMTELARSDFDMKLSGLVPGRLYKLRGGEIAEFAYIGQTGFAIFHPPGEPGMQSSFGVAVADVQEEKGPS